MLVFAKLLRNECDEDFYWVQQNVKGTIRDLMQTYYKVKSPLRPVYEIDQHVERVTKGTITRGECYDLIKHIYEANDVKIVKAELDLLCAKDNLSYFYYRLKILGSPMAIISN